MKLQIFNTLNQLKLLNYNKVKTKYNKLSNILDNYNFQNIYL